MKNNEIDSKEAELSKNNRHNAAVLRWVVWATQDMVHGSTIREALRARADELERDQKSLPIPIMR